MKRILGFLTAGIIGVVAGISMAQSEGKSRLGMTTMQTDALKMGWSAEKDLLDKKVENEQRENVGEIEDLIIAKDKSVQAVIISTGGFLGMEKHDVAISVDQLQMKDGKFTLMGATKESLKALPAFKYEKKPGS
jgi:hypothetical protein